MMKFAYGTIATLVLTLSATLANAALILETATDPMPSTGGPSVFDRQWIGNRFSLSQTTRIVEVGGNFNLSSSPLAGNTVFASFVDLVASPLPSFLPSEIDANDIATFLIDVSYPSGPRVAEDRSVDIDLTLSAGTYAVIFGSGQFGADYDGSFNDSVTSTLQSDPIQADIFSDSSLWRETNNDVRIFLRAEAAVPVPSSFGLMLSGLAACIARLGMRSKRKRA